MKKILFYTFILTLISCSKSRTTINVSNNNIEIIDFNKAMSENVIESFNDYIDSVFIVPLETNDNCFIKNIFNTIVSKDRIILFDMYNPEHQVLIFDINGNFINAIKKGEGPTEIVEAYNVAYNVDKEEIVVSQYTGLTYFTKNGEFIKSADFDLFFTDFTIYNNEYIFKDISYNRNLWLNELAEYYIFLADSNLNVTNVGLPFYYDIKRISSKELYTTTNGIYITMMENDTIFQYKDDTISPAYILKYSDKKYDEIPKTKEILDELENNSGYCFEETFENCNSHQLFCIENSRDDLFVYLIHSKMTNNCVCKIIPRKDFFNGCRTYVIPEASYNDFFVRGLCKEDIEENKKNIEPFLSEKDKTLLNNFGEEDNPILMFYRFKDF